MRWTKKRRVYLLIAIGAIISVLIFGWLQASFLEVTDVLQRYVATYPRLGPVLFVAFAAGSVLFGPLSSSPLVPSAVAIWGPIQTLVYLLGGWLIGNICAYIIGYYLGYPLVKRIVGEEKVREWLKTIHERVTFPVAFFFRLATPSETGYVFGMARYDVRKYLLLTFFAELPYAVIGVSAGQAFFEAKEAFIVSVLVYVAIMAGAAAWLRQQQKHVSREKDRE